MPTSTLEFSVGNRFLTSHPFLPDSNQVDFRSSTVSPTNGASPPTSAGNSTTACSKPSNTASTSDLVSWTAALGAMMRDNRGEDEFGVVLTMTLKEFPQVALPINLDPQGAAGD
jgi:LPS-assembly protein